MQKVGEILQNCRPGTDTPRPQETKSLKPLPRGLESANHFTNLRVKQDNTFENFIKVPGTELVLTAFKKVLDGPRFMLIEGL